MKQVLVAGAGGFIGGHLVLNQLVDLAEGFANIKLERSYDLNAPKGVHGRNSDNTLIRKVFGWQPSIPMSTGLKKTYDWIQEQIAKGSTKY